MSEKEEIELHKWCIEVAKETSAVTCLAELIQVSRYSCSLDSR